MASTTTDDIPAVHDDAAVCAVAMPLIPAMALQGIGHEQTGVGRTQCMPLSAPIKQRLVWGAHRGPYSIVLLAARTKDAFRPPAQW